MRRAPLLLALLLCACFDAHRVTDPSAAHAGDAGPVRDAASDTRSGSECEGARCAAPSLLARLELDHQAFYLAGATTFGDRIAVLLVESWWTDLEEATGTPLRTVLALVDDDGARLVAPDADGDPVHAPPLERPLMITGSVLGSAPDRIETFLPVQIGGEGAPIHIRHLAWRPDDDVREARDLGAFPEPFPSCQGSGCAAAVALSNRGALVVVGASGAVHVAEIDRRGESPRVTRYDAVTIEPDAEGAVHVSAAALDDERWLVAWGGLEGGTVPIEPGRAVFGPGGFGAPRPVVGSRYDGPVDVAAGAGGAVLARQIAGDGRSDAGLHVEHLGPDGERLRAVWVPTPDGEAPLIVRAHGDGPSGPYVTWARPTRASFVDAELALLEELPRDACESVTAPPVLRLPGGMDVAGVDTVYLGGRWVALTRVGEGPYQFVAVDLGACAPAS